METIVELLREKAAQYPANRCLTYRHDGQREQYSYVELLEQSLRAASLLRARGIERGDRIVIWGPNRPEWVFAYFGALLLGAIVVPFDTRAQESFLERIEGKTGPKLVVAGRTQQESAMLPHPPFLRLDTLVEEAGALPPASDLPALGADDIAVLMYTSGTTGDPKGVILSHGNVTTNLLAVPEIIEIEPYFRVLSLLPLSHILEQVIGLHVLLTGGGSIVYIDTLRPATIFEAIAAEEITMMICVPQLLQLFMNGIEREVRRQGKERIWGLLHAVAGRLPFGLRRRLFPTIHRRLGGRFEFFVSGGAYLPPALAQRWENMGIKVLQGYGLTEASPIVSANSLARRKLDSIGRQVSCVELRLAEDGEFLIRGPSVFKGYWQDPEATAEAFADGWYHTGDLGRRDEEGYLYYTGRKKNVIVLANGMNVHAEDVENALRATDLIVDAVVVAVEGADGAPEVHALLAMEDPSKADEVVRIANRTLAPHQQIRGQTVWPDPDFPRTHTLKVRRPEVERRMDEMGIQRVRQGAPAR
ncbi:MAG TPA: AMP-binding protein [Chloroflexota bacterium]